MNYSFTCKLIWALLRLRASESGSRMKNWRCCSTCFQFSSVIITGPSAKDPHVSSQKLKFCCCFMRIQNKMNVTFPLVYINSRTDRPSCSHQMFTILNLSLFWLLLHSKSPINRWKGSFPGIRTLIGTKNVVLDLILAGKHRVSVDSQALILFVNLHVYLEFHVGHVVLPPPLFHWNSFNSMFYLLTNVERKNYITIKVPLEEPDITFDCKSPMWHI